MISNARNKVIKEQQELAAASPGGGRGERGGGAKDPGGHWASQPIHIYGPPGLAQYITMSLGLSETGLCVPLVVHEFSDLPLTQEGGQEHGKNNKGVFFAANEKLKNKITVVPLGADPQSLSIRNKIVKAAERDPANAKNFSWRRHNFGKNGHNLKGGKTLQVLDR